ncbi:GNAT family N-acetyltransferase [Curvibacter sp. CHRR-16]|uniref:GNAT family N-acetyltransferase n=1 Tax=Curvibacter sp. CHRR-16 TaxID=2835872 RepID=UPI002023A2A6|nr:GNAT family N-acetyltransferase [Curvibacter sp. CHRR-16]
MEQQAKAWRVNRALPEHAALLTPLCAAHAAYEQCSFAVVGHTERLHAALADKLVHIWWLELVNTGEAAGYASVTLDWATLTAQPFAHLDCLYLVDAVRGLGAGRMLVEQVIRFAREQGCIDLQWQTPHWNTGAIRFYHRLGAGSQTKERFTLGL